MDGVRRPCSLQGARRCHSRRGRDSGERCGEGGGGMGWGVGGRVGGGGVTLGQVTAMIDDDDDVSTIFLFFPAGLVEIPPCSAQILHRQCGVVVVAIDLARDGRCGCPVIVGTKRIKPRRAPSQVNVARAQGRAQQSSPPRTFLERVFSAKPTAVPASLARPPPSAPLPLRAVLFRRIPTAPSANSLCQCYRCPPGLGGLGLFPSSHRRRRLELSLSI